MIYPLQSRQLEMSVDLRTDYTDFRINRNKEPLSEFLRQDNLTSSTIRPLLMGYADKDYPVRKR